MEMINQKMEHLQHFAKKIPQLNQLSVKTGLKEGHILLAILVVTSLFILIFFGGLILSAVLTVLYPSYKSFKALESKETDEDDKIWLTYWCVFGILTLLDEFLGFLLNYIPYYYYIRLGLFIWMMNSSTDGARIIYRKVMRPLLVKHRSKIEKFINEVKGEAMNLANEAKEQAMKEMSKPENIQMASNLANQA